MAPSREEPANTRAGGYLLDVRDSDGLDGLLDQKQVGVVFRVAVIRHVVRHVRVVTAVYIGREPNRTNTRTHIRTR